MTKGLRVIVNDLNDPDNVFEYRVRFRKIFLGVNSKSIYGLTTDEKLVNISYVVGSLLLTSSVGEIEMDAAEITISE